MTFSVTSQSNACVEETRSAPGVQMQSMRSHLGNLIPTPSATLTLSETEKGTIFKVKAVIIALVAVAAIALVFYAIKSGFVSACLFAAIAHPFIATFIVLLAAGAIAYLILRKRQDTLPKTEPTSPSNQTITSNANQTTGAVGTQGHSHADLQQALLGDLFGQGNPTWESRLQ